MVLLNFSKQLVVNLYDDYNDDDQNHNVICFYKKNKQMKN